MDKLSVRDLEVKGRRVLVRVDFNVPLEGGQVADDTRIVASLPTIRYLMEKGARIILMSHLGRPKGQPDPKYSLKPVAERLSRLLKAPVQMAPDCVGDATRAMALGLGDGQVLLLENLRYHAEEEANDPVFARQLAELGQVYVNDAFGSAHRAHASTEAVARLLPQAAAGFLMQKELAYLGRALAEPKRPFVAVLGGAKISGKIDVIENLLGKVDALLVGGAMMFTFYRARGLETGRSLVEPERLDMAARILEQAKSRGVDLVLPADCLVASSAEKSDGSEKVVAADRIPADGVGVDIGTATAQDYARRVLGAKTVVWNGPMGVFEVPAFAKGTLAVAQAMAEATAKGATTVVGGGDSAAAVNQLGLEDRMSHVSTGGGASLEFLEGKVLPGVAALTDRK
ncbi:MAG TPA: phosphoglycerate kinase [Candidatus Saccharimonadales bacterium]|nr:phosphoglycerate kinase [Candidatus Saccharimonadales bacterium]